MTRFAGVKGNRINVVSSEHISNQDFQVIEIPSLFDSISSNDLMAYGRIVKGEIKCKLIRKPIEDLKVALIGNWAMACGIATYNRYLFPEIAKGVGDIKLFIERNDNPTNDIHQFGEQVISDSKIVSCWKRGESLQQLVQEIKNYSPDILILSHEFGLFPNSRYWLSLLTQLSDYRIIVIMHSVFPNHQDKMVFEAAIPEIIVHLEQAKNNLEQDKKVNARIHVIPHGCYPIVSDQSKLWDNYKSQHTFITQGFGYSYKNFAASIRATAILKDKYPDVFFTALFSESPYSKQGHQVYYNSLIDLVEELNVQENVAIIRGFQSDKVIDAYLRSCKIAVFPYQSVIGHEVFGASGASRQAMAAGIPVITSSIPHFSDVESIKADTPEEIAEQLDRLFSDKTIVKEQIDRQNQFIVDNSWEKTAAKFLTILENS